MLSCLLHEASSQRFSERLSSSLALSSVEVMREFGAVGGSSSFHHATQSILYGLHGQVDLVSDHLV
jgi:hypothetical protein